MMIFLKKIVPTCLITQPFNFGISTIVIFKKCFTWCSTHCKQDFHPTPYIQPALVSEYNQNQPINQHCQSKPILMPQSTTNLMICSHNFTSKKPVPFNSSKWRLLQSISKRLSQWRRISTTSQKSCKIMTSCCSRE